MGFEVLDTVQEVSHFLGGFKTGAGGEFPPSSVGSPLSGVGPGSGVVPVGPPPVVSVGSPPGGGAGEGRVGSSDGGGVSLPPV